MTKRRSRTAPGKPTPADAASTGRERYLLSLLVLLGLTGVVFSQVPTFDFISWDDGLNVYKNPYLNPLTLQSVGHFWRAAYSGLYIPLSYTFYALLTLLAQRPAQSPSLTQMNVPLDPHVYHAAGLLFHLCNVFVVWQILRRLVRTDAGALLGALLFAVHPLQVESVAWISELRGLWCSLFVLLAVWFYVATSPKAGEPACWYAAGPVRIAVPVLLAAAALLCKPLAVCLPVILFAIGYGLLQRPARGTVLELLPMAALVVPFALITRSSQSLANCPVIAPPLRVLVAGDALAFYIGKLLVPLGLTIDYVRRPEFIVHSPVGYVAWIVPAFLVLVAWMLRRRASYVAAALVLFIAPLLPVLGFVPFTFQTYSTVADRYMYLALLGPSVIVAFALGRTPRRAAVAVVGGVIAVFAALSFVQASYWRDGAALYAHALSVHPDSAPIQDNYGEILMNSGHPDLAIPHLEASIRDNLKLGYGEINLGDAYSKLGRPNDALAEYLTAERMYPRNETVRYDLGNTYLTLGRPADAVSEYTVALSIKPAYASAENNLGNAYMAENNYAAAALAYAAVVRLVPGNPNLMNNLAVALADSGKRQDAIDVYRQILAIAPDFTPASAGISRLSAHPG